MFSTPHLDADGVLNLSDCTIEDDYCTESSHDCSCGAVSSWDCWCAVCPHCGDTEYIEVVVPV